MLLCFKKEILRNFGIRFLDFLLFRCEVYLFGAFCRHRVEIAFGIEQHQYLLSTLVCCQTWLFPLLPLRSLYTHMVSDSAHRVIITHLSAVVVHF